MRDETRPPQERAQATYLRVKCYPRSEDDTEPDAPWIGLAALRWSEAEYCGHVGVEIDIPAFARSRGWEDWELEQRLRYWERQGEFKIVELSGDIARLVRARKPLVNGAATPEPAQDETTKVVLGPELVGDTKPVRVKWSLGHSPYPFKALELIESALRDAPACGVEIDIADLLRNLVGRYDPSDIEELLRSWERQGKLAIVELSGDIARLVASKPALVNGAARPEPAPPPRPEPAGSPALERGPTPGELREFPNIAHRRAIKQPAVSKVVAHAMCEEAAATHPITRLPPRPVLRKSLGPPSLALAEHRRKNAERRRSKLPNVGCGSVVADEIERVLDHRDIADLPNDEAGRLVLDQALVSMVRYAGTRMPMMNRFLERRASWATSKDRDDIFWQANLLQQIRPRRGHRRDGQRDQGAQAYAHRSARPRHRTAAQAAPCRGRQALALQAAEAVRGERVRRAAQRPALDPKILLGQVQKTSPAGKSDDRSAKGPQI
jgi:hypothetical protein